MSAKANHIRIGIFVLAAVALFIAGLLAFGARSHFVKKTTFETAIEGEVTGLSVGSIVLLRGVPIGKVSSIDFAINRYEPTTSDMIVVEFEVEGRMFLGDESADAREQHRQRELAKGLRAMVKAQSITGTSVLSLEHLGAQAPPPPHLGYIPRNTFIPSAQGQFTRILESIEQSLRNIQQLDLASFGLGFSNTLGEIGHLLRKINRLDLESTIGNVDKLIGHLNVVAGDVNSAIKSMKLDVLGRNADEMVVGLKQTNAKLQEVLEHYGDVPVAETLQEVRGALQTLNAVLAELKRYPAGFIFGKPPLPAKSVDAPGK